VSGVFPLYDIVHGSEDFRRVVATGPRHQVVAMTLQPGEEIGEETHEHGDQSLLVIEGEGDAVLEGRTEPIRAGDLVVVPEGVLHNVRNTGLQALRLVTIYAPPEHAHGTVHATKAEADAAEHHH
jgi:mannose-6-phosphate isomerase-like protein (cupin superfamily)